MTGRVYVNRLDVFAIPSEMILDTCDRCKDVWTYLGNAKDLRSLVNKSRPINTMTEEEGREYWDNWLVSRETEPLYRNRSAK